MKRPRNGHRVSADQTNYFRPTKKQQQHQNGAEVKEEIVDQTFNKSFQVNHQVTIKKEEPSDDYEIKQNFIKSEFKKEDCKSEFKSEFKSESHLDLFKHEIKRECIKNELDQDCGCEECIQERNNVHHQRDTQIQISDNLSRDDTQLDQHDDYRCPTPKNLTLFIDCHQDSEDTTPISSSQISTNPTLNDKNIEDSNEDQGPSTSTTNHYVRRSNRTTAKPRSSYVSQYIESSDSEGSDSMELSNSEDEDEENDEEEEYKSQSERDDDGDEVDDSPRKRESLAKVQRKRKTEQISTSNKKSKNQTESSGEETEVVSEEHEFNKQLKRRNPKRWITIVHLKCSVCGQIVKDEFELKLHQLTEHQIRRFQCPVGDCTASFEYCEQVPEHKLTEHGELSIWPCRECSFEGNDYKRLLHHRWDTHQEGHFKCSHDGCQFDSHTTRKPVLNHFKEHIPKFPCPYRNCDNIYKHKSDLRLHIRMIHTGERPFACTKCTKSYASQKILNGHVRKVHEAYMPFGCKWPNCTFTSGYSTNIVRHVRVHHLSCSKQPNRDPKDFVEKRFRQYPNQTQNIREKEQDKAVGEEEPNDKEKCQYKYITLRLDCPVEKCSVFGANKIELNQHLLQCHQIEQHRCLLSNCTASFKYLKQLTSHRRNDHKNMDSYDCSKCNYTNRDYKKLISHNYLQHEIGHFPCTHDGCDFVSTTNRQKLDGHRYTHVERKYKCSEEGCTYSAKDKRCFETHLRRHRESNEPKVVKRYDCSKCCRFFPRLTMQVIHEKSHLKDGYRCKWQGCDYFAGHSDRIKVHLCEDHKLKKPASNKWDKELRRKYWKKVQFCHQTHKEVVVEEPKDEENVQVKYITLRLDCPVEKCPEFAANKFELNQHLLQCHQIDKYRCLVSDCTASFKSIKKFTEHRRNDHKNMNSFVCSKCDYSNRDYLKLISHHWLQHEVGHFPCPHDGCDFLSTTNRQKVAGHRYTHLEAKFKCSEEGCTYAAKGKRLLATHLKRHRESKEPKVVKRYDCSKCCRFFPLLTNQIRHEKSHLKDGYRCKWPGCDYFASDTERIKWHLCADHKLKKPKKWDKRQMWKRVLVK